jgi:hypothetical protein
MSSVFASPSRAALRPLSLALLLSGAAALTGCGASVGFLRDTHSGTLIQPTLNITEFRHIKTVYGTAEYTSVLCLFPLGGDVFRHAMENLHKSAGLKQNQLVLNLREDHTLLAYFFFACNYAVTISGDVTEFGPAQPASAQQAAGAAPLILMLPDAPPDPGDVRSLAWSLREAALAAEKDGNASAQSAERAAKAWRTLADLAEKNPYRQEAAKKAAEWAEAAGRAAAPHPPASGR